MYGFWYDYVKPRYGKKAKFCYMDTNNFIVYIKTDDIYKDIGEDVETRFDTSNYELDRPLPKGKNKNSNWINERLIRWKSHGKICWIKSENNSYLTDDVSEDKITKDTKKGVIKRKLKFEFYKNCLEATQLEN